MNAQFIDLNASADFLGPGAIEVNRYQTEIFDIVRRRGVFGQRIKQVPATGHPSRFFEETAINSPTWWRLGTGFRTGALERCSLSEILCGLDHVGRQWSPCLLSGCLRNLFMPAITSPPAWAKVQPRPHTWS